MGIYDRSYLQDEVYGGGNWSPGRSMVVTLVAINTLIWFAGGLLEVPLDSWLVLFSGEPAERWQLWRFVTYGFAHEGFGHLLFNMIGLFIFGREIESLYGRFEFLRIYLTAIVLAGLVWLLMQSMAGHKAILLGASGGVLAIAMLWILHFPMRMIYIWGVLPVRAWMLGTFYIASDLLGLLGVGQSQDGPQVANIAHLTGVAFAYVYYRGKLNLGRLVPRKLSDLKPRAFRPKLRIHTPEEQSRDLAHEVDAILEKISREGESSLTRKERRTLEEASRQYQRRRQP